MRTRFEAGILAMIAGSGIALAQADAQDQDQATIDAPVLVDSTESQAATTDLPKAIAGPFQRGNQAYYLLEPSTWELSEQAAVENFGAHLVTVNNADENSFIRNSVLNFDGIGRHGWLGLTDRDSEGNFVWVNNEPVGFLNWSTNGEPNGGVFENYAGMIRTTEAWFDLSNDWGDENNLVFGVVELDIPGVLAGPYYFNGHTYYLLDQSNRHQADTAARLLGGHLVTLDNAQESQWVRENVIEFDGQQRHTWLGLSDEAFEGIYVWDNDSMSNYRPWISGEPNGGTVQNYVLMWMGTNIWFDGEYDWGANVFGVVEVATPNPCPADMNNDGVLNFFDVSEFLGVFGSGCP